MNWSHVIIGPSSLTEIISYVSQTLDAFVRARDLLGLFSEVLVSDLLPLCSQLLVSSVNVEEFSLLALCVLNGVLNELKMTDCVLPEDRRRAIQNELHQKFLPIICERHILREEPIALLSLRFIQNIWVLMDPASNVLTALSQSKLIPNLFTLIVVSDRNVSLKEFEVSRRVNRPTHPSRQPEDDLFPIEYLYVL